MCNKISCVGQFSIFIGILGYCDGAFLFLRLGVRVDLGSVRMKSNTECKLGKMESKQDSLVRLSAIRAVETYCLSVVPIVRMGKCGAIQWKRYQTELIDHWDYPGCDIGLVAGAFSNLVVVDCDDEMSSVWWMSNRTPTPLMVQTHRGRHFYYCHPGHPVASGSGFTAVDCRYDVRGDNSLVTLPPSLRKDGRRYEVVKCQSNPDGKWLISSNLPLFDLAWRPVVEPEIEHVDGIKKVVNDAWKYIQKIVAVEGSGGNKATFQVACTLRRAGLSAGEAFDMICEWNRTNARPVWTERELAQKIKSAYGGLTQ